MILTGEEIVRALNAGEIVIDPFTVDHVNPNSYNFRLGEKLRVYDTDLLDPRQPNAYRELTIGPEGFVLEPGRLYLAHTVERLGGDVYAPTFAARSSVARLGMFINLSACLGDIGFAGQWTLQLFTAHRVRVYAGMLIGQMMWWKRHGDVDLYSGKYQGSTGPRTSDIHLDHRRTDALATFPRLRSDVDPADVGPKFATLSRLAHHLPVPDAFAVPSSVLNRSIDPAVRSRLEHSMRDLRATVGAFLHESTREIAEAVTGYRLDDATRELLAVRVEELRASAPHSRLAVRSSGLEEDGAQSSLAGVHRSVLGLADTEAVVEAVEEAWRSWFELPALLSRVRTGNFDATPRLALFVQLMVQPTLAGVAFTEPAGDGSARVVVEHVDGLADGLVAGVDVGAGYSTDTPLPDDVLGLQLGAVVDLVRDVRRLEGHEVDVEWAWADGDAHLLQARAVTAALPGARAVATPHLAASALYDGGTPDEVVLGDVAAVYAGYVAKRGPAHRLARELGFRTGDGLVVSYDARGLLRPGHALEEFLRDSSASEFVVDLSPTLRQLIRPRDKVLPLLAEHVAAAPAGTLGHAVVREFVRGSAGVISTRTTDGVLVEVAPEGLLALNRGTAAATQAVVGPDGVTAVDELPADALAALERWRAPLLAMTDAMAERHGEVTLEWVLHDGHLLFTDYSVPPTQSPDGPRSGRVLSPGTHAGPVIDLRDRDHLLERLSVGPAVSIDKSLDVTAHGPVSAIIDELRESAERPVVLASRPYAVLSVLLDHAGAFVFEAGSSLCHLAILLREAGVPAVVSAGDLGPRVLVADGQVVDA